VTVKLVEHNHSINEHIFSTYCRASDLADDQLFAEATFALEVNADSRLLRDRFSRLTGAHYTQRQWDNLKSYHLGGELALAGLQRLLCHFTSFEGSRCLVVDDADGDVAGIVLQTAMQRELFQRWGDTLLLDWTHNTNNLNFYLGAFCVSIHSQWCSLFALRCFV
jgi:hypothetical protein